MDGFNYKIKSIPTMFAGIQMRSRLEARWASFFTNCGWQWTYEPFDAEGWAPDFALHMPAGNIFVEVKPILTPSVISVFKKFAIPHVDDNETRTLLVGSGPIFDGIIGVSAASVGVGFGRGTSIADGDDIGIGICGGRGCSVGMSPIYADYTCWVCGAYDGNPAHDHAGAGIKKKWADACNRSQWRP